jgi:arabinan endo-1,5-alpha-L-arabinosidase
MNMEALMRYLLAAAALCIGSTSFALDGQVQLHDPSTIAICDGKYYVYGTGGITISISDDGWTWRRAGSLLQALPGARPGREVLALGGNNSWAPDVIHIGDKYFVYYAAPGRQPRAAVGLMIGKTLDPDSPDFKWEDGGPVAWSDGVEDCNAIDPGVLLDPNTNKLWLVYGSYFGYIRLVELDPKTGKRVNPNDQPVNIAINCEAPILIFRDGWYYLLGNKGSCCAGASSTYNIRMGRSRNVAGPYLDNIGIDMLKGGGKLFVTSSGRFVGPGHFGLLDQGGGVEKFSCHYEADLDRGGASVLDIRPLLWKDGWPVAGNNFREGTYQIESVRTGTALELAVQGVPVGGARGRGGAGGRARGAGRGGPPAEGRGAVPAEGRGIAGGAATAPGAEPAPGGRGRGGPPIPDQDVNPVAANWPGGNVDVRMSNYMDQAQQKWTFTAVRDAGGYPGSPYFRITIAGTERSLAATDAGELVALASFTGAPEQLWRIDQLTDGTYRLMPKSVPGSKEPIALSALGSSFATLSRFDPAGEKHRWIIKQP